MIKTEAFVVKHEENEIPIPTAWRSIFSSIVNAFVKKDYLLSCNIKGVSPISFETAEKIKGYIESYGQELIPVPEETWESSVCIYTGTHWDVLIDLWTAEEGRSDLVLAAQVLEMGNSYIINVRLVYVP